jgi:hypothetical protein
MEGAAASKPSLACGGSSICLGTAWCACVLQRRLLLLRLLLLLLLFTWLGTATAGVLLLLQSPFQMPSS